MTVLLWVLIALMVLCSVVPALLFVANLKAYVAPPVAVGERADLAVLIPARNEEGNIGAALACVLASHDVALEVWVLDDGSTDATAAIVAKLAGEDTRVRLLQSAALPPGWNGKQHACWQLANASAAPLMLFLDADVRLEPDAIARMAAFQRTSGAPLVSGFPRLITIGFLEWMLLPLIHFVLLGFLPVSRMRRNTEPAMAAGCGQFMLCSREAYFASGGHEAIRATMHDGLLLPRAFRHAGFHTDLADLTELASVRMYDSASKVWQGLAKNATEGIAAPARIVPLTLVLLLGQVLPSILVVYGALVSLLIWVYAIVVGVGTHGRTRTSFLLALAAVGAAFVASMLPRFLAASRFRQPLKAALLHPLGMVLLLCVQWYALVRQLLGHPVGWRQRKYANASSGELLG